MQSFKFLKASLLLFSISVFHSCINQDKDNLPIMGEKETVLVEKDGKTVNDTIYHTIPEFRFVDQDSVWISNEDVADKIYLADFSLHVVPRYAHCLPKIC